MPQEINRRGFLRKSAALGALAVTGCSATGGARRRPVFVTTPRRGSNEEIRVAVIGIRGQGKHHIRAHHKVKNVRVVTLCDVDERLLEKGIRLTTERGSPPPKTESDIRRVLDDKDVDCLSIATPNHWHSLATIWGCQAGKDVYVEKPGSHNIFEGRKMVEAAEKYQRIVQHGTQSRSMAHVREAIKLLHEGLIGDVYMARALCFRKRDSIGIKEDAPVPEGVHYDLWLGPAPKRPFNPNRFHYEWHWNWDYGNGDIGNQGVHQMDVAGWGLGKDRTLPVKVSSMGGRYTYKDQGQTPNTQVATFKYDDDKMLVFEVRGRPTNLEWDMHVGVLFYGSKGYLAVSSGNYRSMVDGEPGPTSGRKDGEGHFANFHEAVRSRDASRLNAPIVLGHYASAHVHLANSAYRLGRTLAFDPKSERYIDDAGANAMLSRPYRHPFVVPEKV